MKSSVRFGSGVSDKECPKSSVRLVSDDAQVRSITNWVYLKSDFWVGTWNHPKNRFFKTNQTHGLFSFFFKFLAVLYFSSKKVLKTLILASETFQIALFSGL